jgi:AP-3 complex subunit delta-1
LNAYRPKPENGFGFTDAGPFFETAEPRFPKSLYLIRPLFSAYELNPVALTAQANVPVPEGLDLDAYIVPPSDPFLDSKSDEVDKSLEAKVKKGRKGKEINGVKGSKGKKKKQESHGDAVLIAEGPELENSDERAENKRVCHI